MMHANAHRKILLLLAILIVMFISTPALAQGNLLDNPGFDEDLSGWESTGGGQSEWATLDASSSPLSGSALATHNSTGSGGTQTILQQCIPVAGSSEYSFGGHIRILPGQPDGTNARVFAITYATSDCSEPFLQIGDTGTGEIDSWALVNSTLITDSTATSMLIRFGVTKQAGVTDDASAYFDNITLQKSDAGGNRIIDEKLSGAWYNPATDGQGIYLDISSEVNMFIGGWYTWTEMAGEYDWMTLQGGFSGEVATLTLYRSTGGKFNDPAEVTTVPIGIAEFRFMSCTEAEFTYKFDGDSEFTVIPLIRAGPAFKGCVD